MLILTKSIKKAKLGGKTEIRSTLTDQDTFPYPFF